MRTPYKIVKLEDLALNVDEPVFADTETCGFYGKVRLLQLYQEGLPEVLIVEWPEHIQLAVILGKYHTVWHNAHYDITTIQQQTETRWVPAHFACTFLLARLTYSTKEKFTLDDVMAYALGYDPYARQRLDKKKLQKSKWDALTLSDDQYTYAATDVYYMPAVWEEVKGSTTDQSYILDKSTLRSCLDFQWNGMHVDKHKLFEVYESNAARLKELNMPINVNSWQQVRPYIDHDESDDLALAKLAADGNKRAAAVREARKLLKQQSFLDKFDTENDYIYGKFKPSARSGRLTSNDQNLQQLPRALKKVFGYKQGEGRVLVYSDYAQVELRSICAIVNCTLMAEKFREGIDLHGFTAEMIFGADWTKEQRQITKTYNFNLLYGGGIAMIQTILLKQTGINQSDAETSRARSRWRNLWREIYAWQERGISDWKKGKLGSTPLGRKYKAKLMTDQLNIENQGAAAEVAKLALHYLAPKLAELEDVKIVNFIHDSFIIDCPDKPEVYKEVSRLTAEAMQEAWFEMSKLFQIKDLPMPVDVKVGYNWGDLEDDDTPNVYGYTLDPYAMMEKVNAEIWARLRKVNKYYTTKG